MSDETTTTEGQSEAAATETPAIPDATEAPRAAEALRALMQQEKATREARQSNIEHEAVVRQSKALQQLAQADPVGFLERSGIKREDISQRLSDGADPVSDIRDDISSLKTELQQQREATEQARMQAALSEARSEVHKYVETAEDTPLVRATGSADQVWQVMTHHHQTTGQIISEAEAARKVEGHLSAQIDRLLESDATRALIEEKMKGAGVPIAPPAPVKHRSTLTNEMQTAETKRVRQDPNMSREASLAEAASILKWT